MPGIHVGRMPARRVDEILAGLRLATGVTVGSVQVYPPLRPATLLGPAKHDLTRDILGIFGVESRFNESIASRPSALT
jgi:hypothetical protein